MIQTRKLTVAVVAVAFGLAAFQAKADHTNLVQNINVRLTGITQGGTRTNGNVVITSANNASVRDNAVVNALGAATGNTFSSSADLFAVTELPDGATTIVVRDGGNEVDVSDFFSVDSPSGTVSTSQVNTRTGRFTETDYSIQHFALHDVDGQPIGLHFDVQGIGTLDSSNGATPRSDLSVDVTGFGDRNGQSLILQGTITVRGHTLEVISDDPGGV